MIANHDGETVDNVGEDEHLPETPEFFTWRQIRANLVWENVIRLVFFHAGFLAAVIVYSFRLHSEPPMKWTILWVIFITTLQGIGITAGAHRMWTHRAFKANTPLRILLMIMYTLSGMNTIFHWVKDHRVHHKYSETDADPHNAKRGFFFSHVGWLMLKRHPEYLRRGREVEMSDIMADPVVMFQKKYASPLKWLICFIIPTGVPVIFWGETLLHSVLIICCLRYVILLHFVWSVNSVAHLWGDRPYNKFINPAENHMVSLVTFGEGSHNYHHTIPWDYKTSEYPYVNFNFTTLFIDAMAKIGWAYDLREPSRQFVNDVIERIGNGSKIKAKH